MAEQHVVVTGAGTGIGRAIARRAGGRRRPITLLARDEERLEAVAGELGERELCRGVRHPQAQGGRAAFAAAAEALGPVTALVAASGLGGSNADGDGRPVRRSDRDEPRRAPTTAAAQLSGILRRGLSRATWS